MIFLKNILEEESIIENSIKKYGYAPEHNFWWYYFQSNKESENVFVSFSDGSGLFTIEERGKKKSTVFASPVAPPLRRVPIIVEYLEHIFQSSEIEKVTLELEVPLYKELLGTLPNDIKNRAINYTLTWPVYDLKMFDSSLPGGHWKTLRKARNKFYQNHLVSVADAKTYKDKDLLFQIINEWRKKRGGHDRTHFLPYHRFIDGNFMGATEARVFIVDNKAVGINAGWLIPNSSIFYGALGIHDYSLPGLGDILYLEDLMWLKSQGYAGADMGGGENALTNFKNKFYPKSLYKTHVFSVVKR